VSRNVLPVKRTGADAGSLSSALYAQPRACAPVDCSHRGPLLESLRKRVEAIRRGGCVPRSLKNVGGSLTAIHKRQHLRMTTADG
jgi:hypothetical protein